MPSILNKGQWCDAPPPRRPPNRKSQWDEVVDALRSKPGKWMEFKDQSRSVLRFVRERYAHLPALVVQGGDHHVDDRGRRRCSVLVCWEPRGAWVVDTDPESEPDPASARDKDPGDAA